MKLKKLGLHIALFAMASMISFFPSYNVHASGNDVQSFPVQKFRFAISNTNANVNSSGNRIIPATMNGSNSEKWYLNWISEGVYEIVSADHGLILTSGNSDIYLAKDVDGTNQRWKIEGVQKDFEGFWLYYKVVSNTDPSKALTFTEGSGFSLATYSSSNTYQRYKLNLDGCEGYAANAKVNQGEKACTIGGLLGETVYVSNVKDMVAQMKSDKPKTIVITANLDFKSWPKTDQTIKDNKTIVGSYRAHDVYDIQWRTDLFWGKSNVPPSNNIVFRNLSVTSRTLNGRVMIQVYGSRNVWFDHMSFDNTINYNRTGNGLDEVGKFIWINTPSKDWNDGCYNLISPDYITLSYLKLHNRYWTVAYGTQNTETTRCRTTVMYCNWDKTVRRAPQIGNGSGHIYSNYYEGYGKGSNGSGTAQIIGGDGSNILSENNRFQGYSVREALQIGYGKDPAKDNNSYLSESVNGNPSKVSLSTKKVSSLNPARNHYGYELISSCSNNGNDVKSFCKTYAGAFSSSNNLKYITDSDMSKWIQTKYSCPFLKQVNTSVANPVNPTINPTVVPTVSPTVSQTTSPSYSNESQIFTSGSTYRIKNVNSGLYLQVEGARTENGTNVQQWGTADGVIHDIWKLIDEGNGYYSLLSAIGDGSTYALDVAGRNTANGANVIIYKYANSDNQKFKITKNSDGSYKIRTKISNEKSAIEIKNAQMNSGANVQQWEINGEKCQDWIFEAVTDPGCSMNTNIVYEFENVNSRMVMDIYNGKMADNTNVQQWTTGHFHSQKWILQPFGSGNYYYIKSYADQNYCLKATSRENGGNIAIVRYTTRDSAMLFRFSKNPDGSYIITSRASNDKCIIEVKDALNTSGANIQQWLPNGNNCQKWRAITEEINKPTEVPATTQAPMPTVVPSKTEEPSKTEAPSKTQEPSKVENGGNSSASKINCSYTINNWGSSYQIQFKLTNEGPKVENWTLKINKKDLSISSGWNINIEESANYYVITPVSWNAQIDTNNTIDFGIQGNGILPDEEIECIVQ